MILFDILNPVANFRALSQSVRTFSKHRALIRGITIRELTDRYAGQVLGSAWAVLTPLLFMAVYVFVFTFIFKGRFGGPSGDIAFTGYMVAGLTPWLAFSEAISRSVTSVSGSANLVKQIVFPVETLPLKIALASLPTLLIGAAVAIAVLGFAGRLSLFGLFVLLPVCLFFYTIMVTGFAYFLAAIGVFFKDLKDIVGILLSLGLFLHPILYPPGIAPPVLEKFFAFSPVSHMIWCFHDALMGPINDKPLSWIIFPVSSLIIYLIGWRLFTYLKTTFGNVL